MEKSKIRSAQVRAEYLPAHRFLGIWESRAQDYFSFWEFHNCDEVCGFLNGLKNREEPVVTCHTAGWFSSAEGERGFFYGMGVPQGYEGPVPEGMELREIPASYYLKFYHPPFDFDTECAEVSGLVEELAGSFDPAELGFCWDDTINLTYLRHSPDEYGVELLRPVKKQE